VRVRASQDNTGVLCAAVASGALDVAIGFYAEALPGTVAEAVVELCRAAGFDARVEPDPQGPMTWETAVRNGGAVGLTTRSSAVSTARGIALVDLSPPPRFAIHLVTPTGRGQTPAVATFRALAYALARRPRSDPSADQA